MSRKKRRHRKKEKSREPIAPKRKFPLTTAHCAVVALAVVVSVVYFSFLRSPADRDDTATEPAPANSKQWTPSREEWDAIKRRSTAVNGTLEVRGLGREGESLPADRITISTSPPELAITYPFEGSLFPPEIVAPTFLWKDNSGADRWSLHVEFGDGGEAMDVDVDAKQWTPSDAEWEEIKRRTVEHEARITVQGADAQGKVLLADDVAIRTSIDEVGSPIFYREVNLPFEKAVQDPGAHIRWRFGSIASKEQPPIIMEKMPVCGNCHSFSRDGSSLGMDVDYGNDKGSYVICPVSQRMVFDNEKIITWSDYKREDGRGTLGLLSQVSPDGRYVVSTVKDRSVFVPVDNLAFSQLFFPIQGILAYYDRQRDVFRSLPGADDPAFVQSNATWSPDGEYVVFARHEAYESKKFKIKQLGLFKAEDVSEFLVDGKKFRFDLWRVPFNGGQGGEAEPIPGASNNGMSNYFPEYSPDGKWIVFCKADSYMLLQADSELYIIPAEGGEARRLQCNTDRMNSWHSWSPNGKWLVFSSKTLSDYTQLFLTHIDEQGRTAPPVVLAHFTAPDRAANIPEFVNAAPDAIQGIGQAFIDDLSYVRAGTWNALNGEFDLAARAYAKAVDINPNNGDAHVAWGRVLLEQGRLAEATRHFNKALAIDPNDKNAHWGLGKAYSLGQNYAGTVDAARKALEIDPEFAPAHALVGAALSQMGHLTEAKRHLTEAIRLDSEEAAPYVMLGNMSLREKNLEEGKRLFRLALEQDPNSCGALMGLALIFIEAPDAENGGIEEAIRLAEAACEASGRKDPPSLMILAQAHAAAGQFAEALSAANEALTLATSANNPKLQGVIRSQIDIYKAEQRRSRP